MDVVKEYLSSNNAALLVTIVGIVWIAKILFELTKENLSEEKEEEIIDMYEPEPVVEDMETYERVKPLIVQGKVGLYVNVNGIICLNFASHDYLGFIGNEEIEQEAMECISECGVGTCGPPLFYGTNVKHLELEKALSEFLGCEQAIIYPQGFAAVSSAIPCYVKRRDIVFADEKINFAIQSGVAASKCELRCFKHNDPRDLEHILEDSQVLRRKNVRGFLIVEGIYKNTGQICPLRKLITVAKKYKLRIFVDESISFCTLGSTGRGVTEHFEIPVEEIDLIMGSFEFALSSGGGFCAATKYLIEDQVLHGKGHIFSAALPPLLVTAASEALMIVQQQPEKLYILKKVCKMMHRKLACSEELNRSFNIDGNEESPVHVLTLKTNTWTFSEEQRCLRKIADYCLSAEVVIIYAAFSVEKDIAVRKPNLHLVSNICHREEHIAVCLEVLEYACVKFCQF